MGSNSTDMVVGGRLVIGEPRNLGTAGVRARRSHADAPQYAGRVARRLWSEIVDLRTENMEAIGVCFGAGETCSGGIAVELARWLVLARLD